MGEEEERKEGKMESKKSRNEEGSKTPMTSWEQHARVISIPRFDYKAPSSLLQRFHSAFLITCTISSVFFFVIIIFSPFSNCCFFSWKWGFDKTLFFFLLDSYQRGKRALQKKPCLSFQRSCLFISNLFNFTPNFDDNLLTLY